VQKSKEKIIESIMVSVDHLKNVLLFANVRSFGKYVILATESRFRVFRVCDIS
jgi:hypothetical protein